MIVNNDYNDGYYFMWLWVKIIDDVEGWMRIIMMMMDGDDWWWVNDRWMMMDNDEWSWWTMLVNNYYDDG